MPTTFARSLRALGADRSRGLAVTIATVGAVLAAWAIWMFVARVPIYAVTDSARLESGLGAHPVEAQVGGRVVESRLLLGHEVKEGDVLVVLDGEADRLKLAEERSRHDGRTSELEALRRELAAEEQTLSGGKHTTGATLAEARARQREAEGAAALARQEAERLGKMPPDSVAQAEVARARADAEQKAAAADAARLEVGRLEGEQGTRQSTQQARVEHLRLEVTEAEGELATSAAVIARLEHEVDEHVIHAAVGGRLAEVSPIRVGEILQGGQKLASILPGGELKATAEFPASAALGRIRPGQAGNLRLRGFPWLQYGSLPVRVTQVAGQESGGLIRVELSVEGRGSHMPLEHGMPGTLEVEIERVSPATLLLRAAGNMVSGRHDERP